MVTMTSPTVPTVPVRRVWTRHERDALPDDGNRYELIDGVLIVSPAPQWRHQRASMRLSVVLIGAVPAELEVLAAPFDVTLSDDTVMEPDLLVAPVAALAQRGLDGAPLLAVEIASPSSRTLSCVAPMRNSAPAPKTRPNCCSSRPYSSCRTNADPDT